MYVCLRVVAALVFVASAVVPALSAPLSINGIANVARGDAGAHEGPDWSPTGPHIKIPDLKIDDNDG
ncbi:hypothetical protein V8E53_005052 [Lactarius tabidus]